MQAADGRQRWMLTFLAAVRFNLMLPDRQANVLSTRPRRLATLGYILT